MTKNIFLFILSAILIVNCNSLTKNNSIIVESPNIKDSFGVKDTTDTIIKISETSEITCPKCGYKKVEKLPIEVCVIKYTCENCKTELTPKIGDCCVYCTYGTHKCPSKQED